MLRALRLIKLIRLVRVSRIFDRWEARMAINYAMLHILTALLQTLLVSHWFACIWGLQVRLACLPARLALHTPSH